MTLQEFLLGLAIGSTLGLLLAAVITQKPFVEKIVAPYIIVLVTTPMLALVPFLRIGLIRASTSGRSSPRWRWPPARWS